MRRILALCLAPCAAACRTNPAIPFQRDHWQFFVQGGTGAVKDDFVEHRDHLALEIVVPRENTAGWGHEVGLRFSGGDGGGLREIEPGEGGGVQPSERELDWRELTVGARQSFRAGAALEPYLAAGLSFARTDSHESYVDTNGNPHNNGSHYEDYGIYLRGGLLWNTLRDVFAAESELKLGFDVRALYATDYSALEFALVLGLGK